MKQNVDPKTWKKIVDLAIAILTAIGGFLTGLGAHTVTCMLPTLGL